MLIITLDFTTKEKAKKIFNKSKRWYKKGLSMIEFAEKLKEVK